MGQRKRKTGSGLKRLLWNIYLTISAISAIIVAVYLVWTLLIPKPDVSDSKEVVSTTTVTTTVVDDETNELVEVEETLSEVLPVLDRKENYYTFLLVGCDDGNGNADTIMAVGYDLSAGTVNLISVPRDTMVERDWTSFPKLNSAYGHGGTDLLREEVSDILGIPIDYTVLVDLSGFEEVVDQLGGIDFDVPEDMYHDDEAGFIIDLKAGYQHLDGYQTLQLVRYRGYASADIGRTQVQQQVLKTLAKKALSWNSVTSVNSFVEIFNRNVETDLSLTDMIYLAQSALTVDMSTGIYTQTLEGRGDAVKNGTSWCYELDGDKTLDVVNTYLNPYTTDLDERYLNIAVADSYLY